MTSQPHAANSHRLRAATLIICYGFVLTACLTIRPLWLDEVLQLIGTTSPSVESMLRWVPTNVGGVPLGYLTQRPIVQASGPNAFWARFPSALFAVAACWLIIILCRELKLPQTSTLLAAAVFMILPAQFRYATEARPYSEALCFSLLAALAITKWASQPRVSTLLLVLLAVVAGLYTQPYTALAVCGLVLWTAASGFRRGDRWRAAIPAICLGISFVLFLPWYVVSLPQWDANIQRSGYPKFHWTLALGLDAFKGISGGSFVCSLAFLVLVAIGVRTTTAAIGGLLLSSALFVLVGALAADAWRDYFFASRQLLFAVPALSILAALGLEMALRRRTLLGAALVGVFVIAALTNDVKMQLNAKEDWPAAANALAQVSRQGYCVQIAERQKEGVALYSVFVPSLASSTCSNLTGQSKVALVSNLATGAETLNLFQEELRSLGFGLRKTVSVGGTTIQMEDR
jgi:4-amino-4-deoxy-L-arabinose transferase-like glycosyltransferase